MSSQVAVVTDSTAYLSPGVGAKYGVGEVPLHVVLGSRTGAETIEISPADVARALSERRVSVSTSRPTPGEFVKAYQQAGSERVVSVHLSASLSGTFEARSWPRRRWPTTASRCASSTASAWPWARLRRHRGQPDRARRRQRRRGRGPRQGGALGTEMLFYVDTLEHLRRGGRIGAAAALFGTALAVKPLLHVVNGQIAPLEKVRTASKALARLEELTVERAGDGPVDLAVHHLASEEKATALAERLRHAAALDRGAAPVRGRRRGRGARRAGSARGRDLPAVMLLLLAAAVGYLCGSVSTATLAARRRGIDLRVVGSGNPGATNVGRALGRRAGIVVALLDVVKGALPAAGFGALDHRAGLVAGAAAMLGHVTSPWLRGPRRARGGHGGRRHPGFAPAVGAGGAAGLGAGRRRVEVGGAGVGERCGVADPRGPGRGGGPALGGGADARGAGPPPAEPGPQARGPPPAAAARGAGRDLTRRPQRPARPQRRVAGRAEPGGGASVVACSVDPVRSADAAVEERVGRLLLRPPVPGGWVPPADEAGPLLDPSRQQEPEERSWAPRPALPDAHDDAADPVPSRLRVLPATLAGGRLDPGHRGAIALLLVCLLAAAVAAGVVLRGRPEEVAVPVVEQAGTDLPGVAAPSPAPVEAPTEVVVAVMGEVATPGVVRLPAGSRVDDALRAAGGLAPGGSAGLLNLARVLVDGEQVLVGPDAQPDPAPPAARQQARPAGCWT
jgi:fatty acid-binding protein DegV